MSDQKLLPSQQYPEYLKMDLGVGTEHAHPLAQALDDIVLRLVDLSGRIALSLDPQNFDQHKMLNVVRRQGFEAQTLNSMEQERLYYALNGIFALRGTLRSVQLLSEIYFPGADVQRGAPSGGPTCDPGKSLVLKDTHAKDQLVFLRLSSPSSDERVKEFLSNCKKLVPDEYEVQVSGPTVPELISEKRISLDKPIRTTQRRL